MRPGMMSDAHWAIETLRRNERTEPDSPFWQGWDAALAAIEVALRDTGPRPNGDSLPLREAVLVYLDHMDKREPYANVRADIKQAGMGGPDFTVDRHFDGDGCFAEMERAALRDAEVSK